jgi:hypothetical protein
MYRFVPDAAWKEPRKAGLYQFDLGNPVRFVDPDGRGPKEWVKDGILLTIETIGCMGPCSTANAPKTATEATVPPLTVGEIVTGTLSAVSGGGIVKQIVSNTVDAALSDQASGSGLMAGMLRPYGAGGGHHVGAQAAFRGDPNYNALRPRNSDAVMKKARAGLPQGSDRWTAKRI